MLPSGLLCTTSHEPPGAHLTPRWLTARDEVWVRAVLDLFDAWVGRTVGERDAELPDQVRAVALDHGVSTRAADGLAWVLKRTFRAVVDSVLDPPLVRELLFEEAARHEVLDREAAIARTAARLSTRPAEVSRALFADRPASRRIAAKGAPLQPLEAIEAYNLALAQGLLLRSERVVVEVREHVRAVVRFAKLVGLLCTCTSDERGTRLELSGPLSILRHTTKYGLALASFFPAALSTAGFRLEARCLLGDEPRMVHIAATDRIARTHKLPRDVDSAVERALVRDLRRLGGPWVLSREANALTVGHRIFFPDFTLRHPEGAAVLVEIVGFYTPEYLRSKLEALRAAHGQPLVVCIDESLACADGEVPGKVLRFKRRVDARALLAAADEFRLPRTSCNTS